jgi:NAD-dependent deacetylase
LPDTSAAHLREYRHSSDLYVDRAVGDKPAATDRAAIHQCKGVNRVVVVLVQLKLLRNMLLFDEDAPPYGVGVEQSFGRFDRNDARDANHAMLLARPLHMVKWVAAILRACATLRRGLVSIVETEKPRKATAAEIQRAAEVILDSSYPIALTGAGMSVESGIPPFRGPGGLWTKYGEPPMNQFQRFMADPRKAWEERLSSRNDEFYKPLTEAKPNPGHFALAELEALGLLRFVITQNVDDLHRQAGQKSLAEIHGNWKLIRCLECTLRFRREQIDLSVLPPRCPECDGILKSDTVSFGEPIPIDVLKQCAAHAGKADLVIVAGTSATVYPAAGFALEVKQRGGVMVEVNLYDSEITPICDVSLGGGSAEVLPKLVKAVSALRRSRAS